MGFRHNNILHNNHFRKDWQRRVNVWFDQPGAKKRRRHARAEKAARSGLKPVDSLRPVVRCPTLKYNRKLRAGRGFTLEELKAARIPQKLARKIGISVDHRRKNRSEESLRFNTARLQAYRERVVVITPKNRQEQLSQSSDAKAENVAAAFPIPAGIELEKPRAITAEEKEFQANNSLREARNNHRQAGFRAAHQAKKEAEEKAKK